MKSTCLTLAIVLSCALGPGCSEKKATCATATDHVMGLQAAARKDKGQEPIDAEAAARRRQRSIEQCKERKVSQKTLDCIMGARTREKVSGCDPAGSSGNGLE